MLQIGCEGKKNPNRRTRYARKEYESERSGNEEKIGTRYSKFDK